MFPWETREPWGGAREASLEGDPGTGGPLGSRDPGPKGPGDPNGPGDSPGTRAPGRAQGTQGTNPNPDLTLTKGLPEGTLGSRAPRALGPRGNPLI